ncbi:ABC transporter ATP-binding protein [Hymenobacter oligotrophus]|uniref:ABC transporter ATP-binding protein n=1 Tax=Hymenobacter oligotrophus TaxID=2319843 RepID=A0A3B7QZ96_9BACT|nr:ABC transporter ATP-binding protein [Hymenobacter oligotrophus]AYA37194.1 ABC transporter ATP-binding protein [Hymenobacter oligotrophus]
MFKENVIGQALRSLLYYLAPADKRQAAIMFLFLIIASLLDVFGLASLVPVVMLASAPGSVEKTRWSAWLYNQMNFESEKSFLIFLIIAIFVFFLVKNVFTSWINYKQVRFTAYVALKIVDNQFQKYTGLPFWKFQEMGTARMVNDALVMPNSYLNGVIRQLFIFLSEIIIVFVVVLGILLYQPALFVILLVTLVPTTLLTYRALKNRSQQVGQQIDANRPKAYGMVIDTFAGFVELKLANKLSRFRNRVYENQGYLQGLEAKSYLYNLLPLRIIEMVAILAVVTIFLYSLLFAKDTTSLVTIVGLFAAAAYRLMPSVNRILTSLVTIKQHIYTFESLALFREREWQSHHVKQQPNLNFERQIDFDRVSFAFPGGDHPVLNDVSFSVRKGEKIGFIGSSGSGKTTLMNLLLRFYEQQQGQIKVDGVTLTPEYTSAWHQLVGYVKQDTFLMEASIRDNITLGEEQPDEQRLQYALEQASLADFVRTLPNGVDTVSGERGARLSGGQRQRIGIARALYKRTQVLVMDEATSALDNQTEREVNEAINKLSGTDITILIIAHRITTLRQCDRIYELKNGQIAAVYSYEELIAKHV